MYRSSNLHYAANSIDISAYTKKIPQMQFYEIFYILVELRGVEPLSESTLTQTSPGADGYSGLRRRDPPLLLNSLTIAQTVTRLRLGSFIMHDAGKAYRVHVLH